MEKITFIESNEFTAWVGEYLADDDLAALQHLLRDDPDAGAVMPGCGGLRKIRIADRRRGKGKRGGARVIYLYVPEVRVIHLMDIYGKGEQADLSADQRKYLKAYADRLKREAVWKRGRESSS